MEQFNENKDYAADGLRPGANNINPNASYVPQYILPPQMQAKKDLKSAVLPIGIILFSLLVLQMAVPYLYMFVLLAFGNSMPASGSVEYQLFYMSFYLIAFLTPSLIYIIFKKLHGEKSFNLLPSKQNEELKSSRLRDYICLSFFTLATTYAGMYISTYIENFINSFGLQTNMELFTIEYDNLTARIINAIIVCVMAPVFEELLFRGAILHALRRFGDTFAIVCSAVVFGLMHGNIHQIPHAVIGGLIFGYIVVKRGSLISSMILHFINNFFVTAFDFILSAEYFSNNETANITVQYIFIIAVMLISVLLLWYYLRKETYKLDADIETEQGKKADAFLPGLTSYRIFFSNPLIIIFIIGCFVTLCATLTPIDLTELMTNVQ